MRQICTASYPQMSTANYPLRAEEQSRLSSRIMAQAEDSGLKRRLRRRLEELGLSPRAASLQAGGSPDLIRGILRGSNRTLRGDNLLKVAGVLGVSANWLLTGVHEHISSEEVAAGLPGGERREHNGASSLQDYQGDVPGAVPEVDARVGAGVGQVGDHEVVTLQRGETYVGHRVISDWVFPSAFLRHELHVQPGGIMVLEVVGDSMSPTLETGDRVIVDTSHSRPTPDGIYVIEEGDGPMVKRLQLIRRSEPAEVRIISDNPRHEPYTLRLDDIRIIGRVSGRVSRM
jgi:phage repressor protein C with HTH and peptisase S24 domain